MFSSFFVSPASSWTTHLRLVIVLLGCLRSLDAATLPTGFAETQIAGNLNPTTMVFAPDGRLFLCEKQGRVRVVKNGAMLGTPLIDFSGKVDSWNERGLESVCVDPSFASNGWIYVYYTITTNPNDSSHQSSHNRVSRFTVSGDTASASSELVLLEITNLSGTGWHNGGGLRFGKDGKLYVSTGENANGGNAQNTGNLLGKVMRINKDGSIPTDNPNYNTYSGINRAIVAMGLRNPFSIAVQPGTGLMYVNNVGANYEEIERYDTGSGPVAVNYGWPGIDNKRTTQTAPSGYRDPIYPYDHGGDEGTALCGGDFYNPANPGADAFPSSFNGRFFFSDYRGWIKYIDPANPGTRLNFA
ncbi:MAG TPA: PQQ-dependent sugar dehydrogenase, partial [Planctomycetota bacterium]|nr:PQQ-dependent sugar dehydrogenase [Planctomycetota bacterium]